VRTLVVYYSLSGNTRVVAEAVSEVLSADLREIGCSRYRQGLAGYVRAGFDSWADKLPPVDAPQIEPADYDLVAIGGPMWAWRIATPVRAWLKMQSGRLPDVAFFLTHGGAPPDKAFREMEALAGVAPKATVAIREVDVRQHGFASALAHFETALAEYVAQ
jgi:flavodoxin